MLKLLVNSFGIQYSIFNSKAGWSWRDLASEDLCKLCNRDLLFNPFTIPRLASSLSKRSAGWLGRLYYPAPVRCYLPHNFHTCSRLDPLHLRDFLLRDLLIRQARFTHAIGIVCVPHRCAYRICRRSGAPSSQKETARRGPEIKVWKGSATRLHGISQDFRTVW